MNTIPARLRLLGAGVLELILLGLAVGFALVTATGIALNANSGVERWQTDIANADLQLDRKTLAPLTQAWCQRDGEAIRQMLPEAHAVSCEPRARSVMPWQTAAPAAVRTPLRDVAVLTAWQKELRARTLQLRDLMGRTETRRLAAELLAGAPAATASQDVAATLHEEVSLEQQAGDDALRRQAEASQRQERWDRWVVAAIEPLLKLPPDNLDPLAMWSASQSLDPCKRRESHAVAANPQRAGRLADLACLHVVADGVRGAPTLAWAGAKPGPDLRRLGVLGRSLPARWQRQPAAASACAGGARRKHGCALVATTFRAQDPSALGYARHAHHDLPAAAAWLVVVHGTGLAAFVGPVPELSSAPSLSRARAVGIVVRGRLAAALGSLSWRPADWLHSPL